LSKVPPVAMMRKLRVFSVDRKNEHHDSVWQGRCRKSAKGRETGAQLR
jgi:hypothetical protein